MEGIQEVMTWIIIREYNKNTIETIETRADRTNTLETGLREVHKVQTESSGEFQKCWNSEVHGSVGSELLALGHWCKYFCPELCQQDRYECYGT